MPKASVNGIEMFYNVRGHGEPLVLIMGLGGGHLSWFFQVLAFKRHYRIVTFDNRGIGGTSRPSEPYTIRTMADDTVSLMDHIGISSAHVLGLSMGGMIAAEMAVNYPDRVRKLILASTPTGRGETGDASSVVLSALGLGEDASGRIDVEGLQSRRLLDSVNSRAFNKRWFRWLASPVVRVYMRRVGGEGAVRQFEASLNHRTLDRLYLITAPTLVMTGTDDRLVPPSCSEAIASHIPGSRLVKFEGGSHTLIAEMRSRFNDEVLEFLVDG
jgi:pimeloyl-ACP methyl ester carboxylesterase